MTLTFHAVRCMFLLLVGAFFLVPQAHAAEQKLVVDTMEVFYGFVPAQIVAQQAERNAEKGSSPMHKGRPRKNFRHLVVALFDQATGQRIADATVDATITPLGLGSTRKRLDPMHINDTVTYGNFFNLPAEDGPFRVVLSIARPGRPARDAAFEYRP